MAQALTGSYREEVDLNKSQKFVRILEALQEPGGANAYELMARFGLDDRTMRRYISDLRGLGLPLESEGRGRSKTHNNDSDAIQIQTVAVKYNVTKSK